jgi:hypothetical protein
MVEHTGNIREVGTLHAIRNGLEVLRLLKKVWHAG